MRPFVSKLNRAIATAAAGLLVAVTLVPSDADARAGRGGSFGSRGSRTWSSPPPTATAPGAQQMQRSTTQPGAPGSNFGTAGAPRQTAPQSGGLFGRGGGLFGGLAGGLMGGLLGAGLFGLLSGGGLFGGLGSMSSIFGLLIQFAVIFFVARFAMNWWRRRQQPATAAAAGPSGYSYDRPDEVQRQPSRFDFGRGAANRPGPSPQEAAPELEKDDFDAFEKLLSDVQDAWSRQDLSRLRGLATPEMVETLAEDLADDASRGVVNKVTDVKLLQGDLAEAWRENGRDYATVAMRYELKDVTEERDTGKVVDGDPSASQEATELWTFLRTGSQGRWLLSAIQQQQAA